MAKKGKGRGQRKKSVKNTYENTSQSKSSDVNDDFLDVRHEFLVKGFTLKEIPGDGNCLFGALGDQLEGTNKHHQKHREDVVDYMRIHKTDFEPFVEDNVTFEDRLQELSELGTYGGNECIVAFARKHKVVVFIHQRDTAVWKIDGNSEKENTRELHISYHNGDHYNSIRRFGDMSFNAPNIKMTDLCPKNYSSSSEDISSDSEYSGDEKERNARYSNYKREPQFEVNWHRMFYSNDPFNIGDTDSERLSVTSEDGPVNSFDSSEEKLRSLKTKLKNGKLSNAKRNELKRKIRKLEHRTERTDYEMCTAIECLNI